MAAQSRAPDAASSLSRYHSAHRGFVPDQNGNFDHFLRKLDASHIKHGYWRFCTVLDEKRAHSLGHYDPESILAAVHCGDGTYKDIRLRWVPGSMDSTILGPLSGNAVQHIQNIHEARRFLGKSMAIPGDVPLYPVEPRMKGFWEAKRAAVSKSSTTVGVSTAWAPALPSSYSSRLPSPQVGATAGGQRASYAGIYDGRNDFTPTASLYPSPTAGSGPRNSMAPAGLPVTTPSRSAQPHSPAPSLASQYPSQISPDVATQRYSSVSDAAQHLRTATEPRSHGAMPTSLPINNSSMEKQTDNVQRPNEQITARSPPAKLGSSRPPTHAVSSQPRSYTIPPHNLNRQSHHRRRLSSPSRPDVMAGHLTTLPAPSPLVHHPQGSQTASVSPYAQQTHEWNNMGLSSTLNSQSTRPSPLEEARQPQLMQPDDDSVQSWESPHMVSYDSTPTSPHQSPGTRISPVATSANLYDGMPGSRTNLQEAANRRGGAGPSSTGTDGTIQGRNGSTISLKRAFKSNQNDLNQIKRRKRNDSADAAVDASTQAQPVVENMYPGLACMDCGEETGHTMDCCVGNLQPLKNPTILDYRNLTESVEQFDPGPWTTHQGPPPDPEPESVEDQIQGMAEVIRNEDSYKNDASLHCLPDDLMITLWALKTSPNVEIIDDFADDSGIGGSETE